MFRLIKFFFVISLTGLVNESNHTKCILLSNQKCKIQPTLINLHHNKYNHEFQYYPFGVKLDRCVGSRNALNDFSNKACVPNKTEDLKIHVFSVITGKSKSKILTNDISCKCKRKFDRRKRNSNRKLSQTTKKQKQF